MILGPQMSKTKHMTKIESFHSDLEKHVRVFELEYHVFV